MERSALCDEGGSMRVKTYAVDLSYRRISMRSTQALATPATNENMNPGTSQKRPAGHLWNRSIAATVKEMLASCVCTILTINQRRGWPERDLALETCEVIWVAQDSSAMPRASAPSAVSGCRGISATVHTKKTCKLQY